MLPLTINSTPHQLRTNWNEVTLADYINIVKAKGKPVLERLAIYTGLSVEELNRAKLAQLQLLSEVLEFMDAPEVVHAFAVGYDDAAFKIGEHEYWKIEKAKQLLKDNPEPLTVAVELIDLYTSDKDGNNGQKVGDKPVTETIGMALFFCNVSTDSLSASSV